MHINDNSKPLIFIGSNSNILMYAELAEQVGIQIKGIIDTDYFGNTTDIDGIPIIDSVDGLIEKIEMYRTKFNFFCATNWLPMKDELLVRNTKKRLGLIQVLEENKLSIISLIDPTSVVSKYAKIGRNVYLGAFTHLEPHTCIDDYVSVYHHTGIGHHSRVGFNSIVQRQCAITSNVTISENCFISLNCKLLKWFTTIEKGTWIQNSLVVERSTIKDEIVSIYGSNTKRIRTSS
jgi:carbonic anhydrase/acetyltransferase-like protein (isoleucine patch superfamily)